MACMAGGWPLRDDDKARATSRSPCKLHMLGAQVQVLAYCRL